MAPRPRVAVLHQALEPPTINDAKKPMKPGGYRDSGADICFTLKSAASATVDVVTPTPNPDPSQDVGWTYPDTEDGIMHAIADGATYLWANAILFASHPLQASERIGMHQDQVRLVGQPPLLVEKFDDKEFVNEMLRKDGRFPMPRAWSLRDEPGWRDRVRDLQLVPPVVAKPVRGRGSHGVKVCRSDDELIRHVEVLFSESPSIMLEEFLNGEEATVTVMPPMAGKDDYWALPVVTRFNHVDGIAPYNGIVAVTRNSRAVTDSQDPTYNTVTQHCENAARLLGVTAPIRIDVRRRSVEPLSEFALFDVNMKPNMTGPGRPGRDDQDSLTLMAARALGWDYPALLSAILGTARTLREVRQQKPVPAME